jgi:hypothetical protein
MRARINAPIAFQRRSVAAGAIASAPAIVME